MDGPYEYYPLSPENGILVANETQHKESLYNDITPPDDLPSCGNECDENCFWALRYILNNCKRMLMRRRCSSAAVLTG